MFFGNITFSFSGPLLTVSSSFSSGAAGETGPALHHGAEGAAGRGHQRQAPVPGNFPLKRVRT